MSKRANYLTLQREKKFFTDGYDLVVGIDEAGRGPWAGPVSVAAYIIKPDSKMHKGVHDSKSITSKNRLQIYEEISIPEYTLHKFGELEDIDSIGVSKTIEKSIDKLIRQIQRENPNKRIKYLLDGYFKRDFNADLDLIIKGDSKFYCIAAASLIAKVTRDKLMIELAKEYPEYSFETNMGYGTKKHQEALQKYGVCKIHRTSFAPIKALLP